MNFSARLFVFFSIGKQQENSTNIKMIAEGKRVSVFESKWSTNAETSFYNRTCQQAEGPCMSQLNVLDLNFLTYIPNSHVSLCVCMCVGGLLE